MKPLILSTLLAVGCAPALVPVRIDDPLGARVTIEGATSTEAATPLVARFEEGSAWWRGYPIVFDLDAAAAQRYGGAGALRIYGRLNVGRSPWFTRDLPLKISPDEAQLRSLVAGELDRVVVAACGGGPCSGCDGCGHKRRRIHATMELRLTPF